MTDKVATTLRSCYLAGPMRGIDEYNFPVFTAAAGWLRQGGWKVFSPHERDWDDEAAMAEHASRRISGDWSTALPFAYYMAFDLQAVCRSDAVVCLPAWEASQGARLECLVATELGHPIFALEGNILRSVEPDYVRGVFDGSHETELMEDAHPGLRPDPFDDTDEGEDERHSGSARFHELLNEIGDLHDRKQADYGSDKDPFANVRASDEWGIPAWVGAFIRLNDKVNRLKSFALKGSLANESAEDSMRDIAVYALIGLCLYEEEG